MFEIETAQIERLARMHPDKPKFQWVRPVPDRIWGEDDFVPDNDRAFTAYNTSTGRRVIKEISVPRIASEYNYAVALHELGHAYANSSNEILANRWAVKNALYWTPTMTRALMKGLETHICYCGKCNDISVRDYLNFAREMNYELSEPIRRAA